MIQLLSPNVYTSFPGEKSGRALPSRKWSFVFSVHALSASTGDQSQDLLGKGNDNTTGHGEHSIGSLAGVMGFKAEADLKNAEAQQDNTHGPY